MGRPALDITGKRFGRLTAIAFDGDIGIYPAVIHSWKVKCDCGVEKVVRKHNLSHATSCGCIRREKFLASSKTHGLTNSRTYRSWIGMRARCYRVTDRCYAEYGGRGITVCQRWVNSFENFLQDMGEVPPKLTLDRIDNSKGYYPENCRWASAKTQANNRRPNRFSKKVEAFGESKILSDWAKDGRCKVGLGALRQRLNKGIPVELAISYGYKRNLIAQH